MGLLDIQAGVALDGIKLLAEVDTLVTSLESIIDEYRATGTLSEEVLANHDWRDKSCRRAAGRVYNQIGEFANEFQPKEDSDEAVEVPEGADEAMADVE